MMSHIYDKWEKLVGAVLRRERDRQLVYFESISTSYSTDFSSGFSFEIHLAGDDHFPTEVFKTQNFDGADLYDRNIFFSGDVKAIEYEEIRKATRDFRAGNMLGGGPFGCVYKGWIDENYAAMRPGFGIPVAIKMLNNATNLRPRKWVNEVNSLVLLRHRNLLTPIGYRFHRDIRIFNLRIHAQRKPGQALVQRGPQPLPWAIRMKVATGAAKALAFLHGLEKPVIYTILKSDYIILDGDFNTKLFGFGLPKDISRRKTEGPLGVVNEIGATYCPYAAPEYIATGKSSTECDVYSFGVVLVELITGLRALDRNRLTGNHNLVDWAKHLGSEGRRLRFIDRRLEGKFPYNEAHNIWRIAFHCVSSDPRSRPRMAEVVTALQQF